MGKRVTYLIVVVPPRDGEALRRLLVQQDTSEKERHDVSDPDRN